MQRSLRRSHAAWGTGGRAGGIESFARLRCGEGFWNEKKGPQRGPLLRIGLLEQLDVAQKLQAKIDEGDRRGGAVADEPEDLAVQIEVMRGVVHAVERVEAQDEHHAEEHER